MKIALIGSGSIAEDHAAALRALRDEGDRSEPEIALVVGRRTEDVESFARAQNVPRATIALDEALDDPAIEAVVICSPTDAHAGQTARALRAGKHVLCEIPLATSLAETDDLIQLAEEAGRVLMVCHTQRYFPPLVEARRRIAAGEIYPHALVSRYLFNRRDNVNWKGRRRSWTDNLLWHHGCHAVDATLWLLGADDVEVESAIAPPDPKTGIPMDLSIIMRTPRGQIATVAMSYHAMLPAHDYLILGEETTLHFAGNALHGPEGEIVPAPGGDPVASAMLAQDREFLAAIREQREPAIAARSVRPAMAVLQAAQDEADRRGSAAR